MKKSLTMVVLLAVFAVLLCACKKMEDPKNEGHNYDSTPAVEDTTKDASKDEATALYENIEDLASCDDIISVERSEYKELSGIDLSSLPEEAREVYTGISETLTYHVLYEVDGCKVSAYISAPLDYLEKLYPIVIYNRGGNGNYGANTAMTSATCSYYTKSVVIASNYREASPGTGKDEFGGADVADVVFFIDLAECIDFADREKVYMIGESRGGMQTCLALVQDTAGVVQAACCVSGAYDMADTYDKRTDMRAMLEKRIGGTPLSCPEEYTKRSAVTFAEDINTPLLLIHSVKDAKAPYSQAKEFARELEEDGKVYELITRDDNVHCISSPEEYDQIMEWFYKNSD